MAGTILERELTGTQTGGVSFSVAAKNDDTEIRRLLRENPMPGRISLSFEREPNFFAESTSPSEIKQTIVARESGRLVCVGSCAIRPRYVNGKPRMVGYLGGLRLDARSAGRFDILRRGYKFFRQLQQEAPADFYFTSIAADNDRARTFLERGLAGMPRYEFVCEFVTLMISTLSCRQFRLKTQDVACPGSPNEMLAFVNELNTTYQFAPHWSAEALDDCEPCVVRNGHQLEACGALWDQRQFKQVVVRGYSAVLAKVRPVLNNFSRLTRQPRLPAIGEALSIAFASHLASKTDESLLHLIQQLANSAGRRGIELLTLGFASNDPRLELIQQNLRCHEYRSRLYVVHWPGVGAKVGELDNRVLAPEVALL
jgi:hypothetical protein